MVSRYAFEHGKTSSNICMHRGCYAELRGRYRLPSQMACTVEREVAAAYKGQWTKLKKNGAARSAGHTKKRYKGLDQPPKFVSPTLTYQHGKDYSLKGDQHISLLTLEGRVIVPYQGYAPHLALLRKGAQVGAAKLWYDKPHKQYYLLVSFEVERPDPTPEQQKQVVGVDVGVRYLAVSCDYKGTPTFYSGKRVRARANHYARLRKRLQKKGTRTRGQRYPCDRIKGKSRGKPMPKRATQITLCEEEQTALVRLTKRHGSAQQLVLRARIVLAANEGQGNAEIARHLSVTAETARLWRDRWAALQDISLKDRGIEERLADAPRPGVPARITAEQRCQMEVLACEAPSQAGRPISQWSGREIAEEMVQRGIVERISRRHAARLLKKGAFNRTGFATG